MISELLHPCGFLNLLVRHTILRYPCLKPKKQCLWSSRFQQMPLSPFVNLIASVTPDHISSAVDLCTFPPNSPCHDTYKKSMWLQKSLLTFKERQKKRFWISSRFWHSDTANIHHFNVSLIKKKISFSLATRSCGVRDF